MNLLDECIDQYQGRGFDSGPSRCKAHTADYNGTSEMGPAKHLRLKVCRRSRFIFLFFAASSFVLTCSLLFAIDPHQALAQLYHSSWSAKQGVNGDVTALAQTTDGYLWLGTTDGLLRFDGISFEQFRPENGSLMSTSVSALMAVPDGGLWVGFDRGGASFLKNGRVTNYSSAEGFPVSSVRCFARDQSGSIWTAAVGGLAHLEGQRWKMSYREWNYPAKTAWYLLVDSMGTLWVATGNQILFLPNGKKQFEDPGIHAGSVYVLAEAPDGAIWFDDDNKISSVRRNKAGQVELLSNINISASAIVFDRDGGVWIGDKGVSRIPSFSKFHGSKIAMDVERFHEADGLANEEVEAMLEDREGNIWVGSDGGLDRFRPRNVKWFPLRDGPFTLVVGPGGDVWAGPRDPSPIVRVEDRKTTFQGPDSVYTAYRDPDGSIWFAAHGSLVHWENGRFVNIAVPHQVLALSNSATPPDPIIASAITKDRSGSLWVTFDGSGEFRLKDGVWDFVPILPDHRDWSAVYAFTDNADRIWLSFSDRIACNDHGNVRIFGAKEGLAIGPPTVITGTDQRLWVGGESGLSIFQNERFHTIHSTGGAGFVGVTGIVLVQNQGIWLSTGLGIVHIPESEVTKLVQQPEYEVTFELFDLISDLPEPLQRRVNVFSSGAIQATDGTLWFATRNGAIEVDPAHIYRNPVPPPVSIRSVVADGKSYSPFSKPEIPALTKDLEIDYAALSLSIPERVRFRYKLGGWGDKEWHEAGGHREALFTNLRPGKYSFRVSACNNDGVWNETGATLDFVVAPAWFQTTWFYSLCVLTFLASLWGLYQLRVRQLQQQFAIGIEARVNERTRIARELHDTLLQTLHGLMFQFQAVRNLLPRRPDQAIQSLDEAINETEKALAESRDAIQGLRSEPIAKGNLSELLMESSQDFANLHHPNRHPPAFELIEEGERRTLSPTTKNEVCRIAVEVLRNAFRHSQAARIEAEVRYDAQVLRVRIRDNGIGIDPKVLKEGGVAGHWGLRGVHERSARIGAQLDFWSETGAGTEVQLTVPAALAYETSSEGVGSRLLGKDKRRA
jgi:signal transduction histidine kinase/ligand-binding sensor domain-containing protein